MEKPTFLPISINSINEQYHSSKAVVLLFLINAAIQCAFHLLKFLRYRNTVSITQPDLNKLKLFRLPLNGFKNSKMPWIFPFHWV